MKTPRCFVLLLLSAAACSGPRPAWKWEGPERGELRLGDRPGPDPRDPVPCAFPGGKGLRFSPRRATLAVVPAGRIPAPGEPLTVAVLALVEARPGAKASLVSRWECAPGRRSFDLGVTREGSLYFTASASGSWPEEAKEIRTPPLPLGVPFLAAASFLPGKKMRIIVNGKVAAEASAGVPGRLFPSPLPVQLGNRGGSRERNAFCGIIAGAWIFPAFLEPSRLEALARARGIDTDKEILPPLPPEPRPPYDLDALRAKTRKWYETLVVKGAPYGAYAMRPGGKTPSLYASADLAWIRWICNDLEITGGQRREWIAFLRSRRNPDGTYRHRTGHCPSHAFCHVTGALHMLGAPAPPLPPFLEKYMDPARVPAWLESIHWKRPWGASHDIWGAGLPIACSPGTPREWRDAFFGWLDAQADPETGFWRKGVPTRSRLESLGGAFHVWVVYGALNRPIPYPERVIDSVLSLQEPSGSFGGGFGYGDMDALWILGYLYARKDYRRRDIREAMALAAAGLMDLLRGNEASFFSDAHSTLSRIASLAACAEVLPGLFKARKAWRNPWARRNLFVLSFKNR